MKGTTNRFVKARGGEILRFFIVGSTAVLIQYGAYLLLVAYLLPTLANTLAYLISFAFNYVASLHFTFRVHHSRHRSIGFALAHIINFLLQTALLNLFLWLGLNNHLAMLPTFAISVPTNFLLVRTALRPNKE